MQPTNTGRGSVVPARPNGPEHGGAGRPGVSRSMPAARRVLAGLAAVLLGAAACSTSAGGAGGQPTRRAAGGADSTNLAGICPPTVVVQASWYPQVEHSAVYQLVGKGYRIDGARKRVSGPLVARGGLDTGVRIEVRAGGPAIGGDPVSSRMFSDPSITLGMLNTDELIAQSSAHPMLGVVAPLTLDPQVLMWDPTAHREFNTIADIGQTATKVVYYQNSTFMEYLLGSGILRRSQVDPSYDGNPARFVAARGTIVVQGYATNDPHS